MDELDISEEREHIAREYAIGTVRNRASLFIPGEPGDCDKCGESMPRLVNGWCCRCRDRYEGRLQ